MHAGANPCLQGWSPIRCTTAHGYSCPSGSTFGLLVVAAFANNTSVAYRLAQPCVTDCEAECLRRADCVGFTATLILLGRGGLSVTGNARCGSTAAPCPTVQMQFRLPDDCGSAFGDVVRIETHGTVFSSVLENCTISVSARATRSDAWMTIPRIGPVQRNTGTSVGVVLGLLIPAIVIVGGIAVYLHFH